MTLALKLSRVRLNVCCTDLSVGICLIALCTTLYDADFSVGVSLDLRFKRSLIFINVSGYINDI